MLGKTISLLVRIPIYLFFFWLAFFFLLPRIEPELLAMIIIMPLASLALLLDIFITAKIQNRKAGEVVAGRIVMVDNILAQEEDRISSKRRLETLDVEALPEERTSLPNPDRHEQ